MPCNAMPADKVSWDHGLSENYAYVDMFSDSDASCKIAILTTKQDVRLPGMVKRMTAGRIGLLDSQGEKA